MKRHLDKQAGDLLRRGMSGLLAAAVTSLVLGAGSAADAQMRIKLKDGREITVPVDPDQVESVTFDGRKGEVPVGGAPGTQQPIKRAADRIRDDGERVRSARDAEQRALDAAAAAEAAAREAAEAAARATRAATAASAARKTAEGAAHAAPGKTAKPAAPPAASVLKKKPSAHTPRTLKVGPGEKLKTPSQAAKAARDGDTIEIAAGIYRGDVAEWFAHNLTIRGVGGRAHMDAQGRSLGGKAIWVIAGNNTVVENIEFSNCRVRDRNGAGIRLEGRSLTVRNSYFHDNQMGILTGRKADSDVLIEGSEFARNIVDYKKTGSLGHNIYIGGIRSFTLRNSYVHGAAWGHNVKSRALENRLLYNRIEDGRKGSASYQVDIATGGRTWLVGNLIQQSKESDNWSLISFGAEGNAPTDRLAMVNNTLVNDRGNGVFVQNRSPATVVLINNILAGPGTPVEGPAELRNNLIAKSVTPGIVGSLVGGGKASKAGGDLDGNFTARAPGFVDAGKMDYRLAKDAPARDIGAEPGLVNGWPSRPSAHYVHPLKQAPRPNDGKIDIGAYEYSTGQSKN